MNGTSRQRSFKKGIDANANRRQRADIAIQIRRTQKEQRLNQRRRVGSTNDSPRILHPDIEMHMSKEDIKLDSEDLTKIAALIQSRDATEQTFAVSQLRRLLSKQSNPPIQKVINLNVIARLVAFLRRHDKPILQFEAAWVLTNIASGSTDQTQVVIRNGAVPLLCELMLSPNDDVCEQAIWALGNISGDSPACRDIVLNSGAVMLLLTVIRRSSGKRSIIRNATWTLSNFCRGQPRPPYYLVSPALELLPHLICSPDEEVQTDACWTLSFLADGGTECIQAVIDTGVCSRVLDLVGHSLAAIQTPALRIVGSIVAGSNKQTQHMIDLGILYRLIPLFRYQSKMMRKEVCWTISNITAGDQNHIQAVIDAGIIPPLLYQLASLEFDVQKEAAWAISNATLQGSVPQIQYLVDQGCVPPLVRLLKCSDASIIHICLDAMLNILKAGDAVMGVNDYDNQMAIVIEEAEGVEVIQALQYHEETSIYDKAVKIIQDYYDGDELEEYDDEINISPAINPANQQFSFGVDNNRNAIGNQSSQTIHFDFHGV